MPARYWLVFARGADALKRGGVGARVFFVKIKKIKESWLFVKVKERWPLDRVEKVKKYLPIRAIRITFYGLEYVGIVFLLVVVFIGFSPRFDFPGGYKSLVVLSGSMEPAIRTGSVVVVQPRESYGAGEVVTISKKLGGVDLVTHRIVGVEGEKIVTKGDANDAPDNWELTKEDIEGKVIFSAPYLGYAVNFAKSVRGFMLLVILPAVLIILSEFWEIKKEIEKSYEKKLKKALGSAASGAKKVKMALLFLVFSFSVLALSSGATVAVMSDTETIPASITVGTWGEEDASPDVVINEVMWMGSTVGSGDEWIELKNTTDHEIDVGQWTIENAKESNGTYMVPSASDNIIPAYGFFLIANWPENNAAKSALNVAPDVHGASLSFKNSGNGNLVLKDAEGNVVDEAKGDAWPAGNNKDDPADQYNSMERNSDPGDGTLAGSWHTCLNTGCNDGTFWDTADGDNYGTPGAANLSENDPTSLYELRWAGPTSGDEGSEELMDAGAAVEPTEMVGDVDEGDGGGGDEVNSGAVVDVVVEENTEVDIEEPAVEEEQEEENAEEDEDSGDTGDGSGDEDSEVILVSDEESDVVDVGGAGEGDDPAAPDDSTGQGDESDE